MDTHNIISTPDITGNIGSCTTKAERFITDGGFWSEDGQVIATNSCTGKVDVYPYHSVATGSVVLLLLGVFFAGCILTAMATD